MEYLGRKQGSLDFIFLPRVASRLVPPPWRKCCLYGIGTFLALKQRQVKAPHSRRRGRPWRTGRQRPCSICCQRACTIRPVDNNVNATAHKCEGHVIQGFQRTSFHFDGPSGPVRSRAGLGGTCHFSAAQSPESGTPGTGPQLKFIMARTESVPVRD